MRTNGKVSISKKSAILKDLNKIKNEIFQLIFKNANLSKRDSKQEKTK